MKKTRAYITKQIYGPVTVEKILALAGVGTLAESRKIAGYKPDCASLEPLKAIR